MLAAIAPHVLRYCQVISTVTNINVEVVDKTLTRIAGTGMYEENVGASIETEGEVYRHVLKTNEPFVMINPREHELCTHCTSLDTCQETLLVCTPILYNNKAIGVIGLVCFTQAERARMLAHLDVYKDFVEQMASTLVLTAREYQKGERTKLLLDMFLHLTDNDDRGLAILNTEGRISYSNETARRILNIEDHSDTLLAARHTGTTLSGMEELEITVGGKQTVVLGRFSDFELDDASFAKALMFDSLPEYTKMLSRIAHASEGAGLGTIIGESHTILELKQRVLQIASTMSTVLITGESGTGKEMFARAIHAASDRSNKPFIPINCGAIPDTLLESELFGYVSGAFTGANPAGYIGKFELAHGGVLFLDEIGAMPLYLQVKLLRVLQDRRITRLGSNRVIDVDVRIIAATNELLPELIEQRMFRDDLYYRLNVIPLFIPPLRERLDDIPAFASFFLHKYCQLFSKKNILPSPRLIKALCTYNWPGNVREFENVMEYLVNIIPDGGTATEGMLPQKILAAARTAKPAPRQELTPPSTAYLHAETQGKEEPFPTLTSLAAMEKKLIQQAVATFGQTTAGKQQAADILGIGIATLYRKIKEYHIA